jgi:hypothetical protein
MRTLAATPHRNCDTKLDERRAYLVFLHRNLSARRQAVKQIQWHQWFAANGLEAPALHGMRFDRSFLAIATAADTSQFERRDETPGTIHVQSK